MPQCASAIRSLARLFHPDPQPTIPIAHTTSPSTGDRARHLASDDADSEWFIGALDCEAPEQFAVLFSAKH